MNGEIRGRGAPFNTPNRFEQLHAVPIEVEWEDSDGDRSQRTQFFRDHSKTILAKNDSPDVPFTFSLNPYRGCEHGCVYCYARPTHEYLGFSAGLDFETKIMVKKDAPDLLEKVFRKPSWQPQVISLSGNTDCYQPIERKLRITRRCLEVFLKYRNPVGVITKNNLVTRDIDLLKELAAWELVRVFISITSLDPELTRTMEPRTSAPRKRLECIEALASAGIPVGVNVAPLIPGLNDEELPGILQEAASRGARFAGYLMLRLPLAVEPMFVDWLQRAVPQRASKILSRIRGVRGGKLSDAHWGRRMKGEGKVAETLRRLFQISCERYGLNKEDSDLSTDLFQREPERQLDMFR